MFELTSRYYGLKTLELTDSQGRVFSYVSRRFLPQNHGWPVVAEVAVTEGDRLDLIAARTFGDGEQFWRLCDANSAMHPGELTLESGRILSIALPQGGG
jgi:hypothetical protein